MLGSLIKTAVFVLPLGLDVLSVSTALGALGLTGRARWRVSLVLATCQVGAMFPRANWQPSIAHMSNVQRTSTG